MSARGSGNGGLHGFLRRTFAMLTKEFIQLRRDRVSFAMIVVLPIMQLLLFGYAINTTPRNLPTAVLLQNNREVGRIPGYLGPENFFHAINHLLAKVE